ncbi:MAG: UXX-star (seleno)protein family 2 [Dehalococcoidia bacterium]
MAPETDKATVVIYTHPDCTYSAAAKDELQKNSVPFREIDISKNPEAILELERLTGGERITPVLVEGDAVTVGYYGAG